MLSQLKYFILLFLLLQAAISHAQSVEGKVYDKETNEPITYATVSNRRTKVVKYTDMFGKFRIEAQTGDTIFVAHPAYEFTSKVIINPAKELWIYAEKKTHELQEVEVLSDMAKFQKDSADRHIIYRKTLKDAKLTPSLNLNNGIAMDGIFSSLALWISGKGKKNKEFAKMLVSNEKAKFIAVKYNPQIVTEQTGLNEEEAMQFMMEYPMPYDYARAATPLEIKMWIRTNYREWIKTQTDKDSLNTNTEIRR